MNYFELFEIPVGFHVDKNALKRKYFELSRKFHPDYFVTDNNEEQKKALETSAQLNKGLKTLSNKDEIIPYLLKEKGMLQEEEKYSLPSSFLMQMMDLNEELAEAGLENNEQAKKEVRQRITDLQHELYKGVKSSIDNYKEGVTAEKELLLVKDYYFKKKYLDRLNQQLS